MKKTSKTNILKKEISSLKDRIGVIVNDRDKYLKILEQLIDLFERSNFNSMKFSELPREVMMLKMYKEYHQGAYHSMRYVVEDQREIIRWLIKPSTAEKSNDKLRKENLL